MKALWIKFSNQNYSIPILFPCSNRRRQPSGSSISSMGLPSLSPSPIPPDSPFSSPKVQRHDRHHKTVQEHNTQGKSQISTNHSKLSRQQLVDCHASLKNENTKTTLRLCVMIVTKALCGAVKQLV